MSIIRRLLRCEGVEVPSPEGAMLRVPKDTPESEWQRVLEIVREARSFLEAEPTIPPPPAKGMPTLSL